MLHRMINAVLRRAWTGQFSPKACSHLGMIRDVRPSADVCEACVALGDGWPGLRMCLTCGFVGCCDQSKNKHSLQHFRETGHPLVRPHRQFGMSWIWCRLDEALLDPA